MHTCALESEVCYGKDTLDPSRGDLFDGLKLTDPESDSTENHDRRHR